MADTISGISSIALGGRCECGLHAFSIDISDISCNGCWVEAKGGWPEGDGDDAFDFLHLIIDERIQINGKVVSLDGHKAWIRFFGELHPTVVDGLARAA